MRNTTTRHPKALPETSVQMQRVCMALLPATAVMVWQWGPGILINLALAVLLALGSEALLLRLRQVPIAPFLKDRSAIVSAWLIVLALPPCVPWWTIAVAVGVAIIAAKQLYGGLGNNIFNPAMAGYALAILAFPLALTQWPQPFSWPSDGVASLMAYLSDYATCFSTHAWEQDGFIQTGATPLTAWRFDLPLGGLGESMWLYPNLAFLLGGLWLLYKRVITWHIPAAFLGTLALTAGIAHLFNPELPGASFHLLNGATMIAAFFICTDPVTAPKHQTGMLVFGAGVALLLLLFRHQGHYLDGLAFAVLLMNLLTPLWNRYAR